MFYLINPFIACACTLVTLLIFKKIFAFSSLLKDNGIPTLGGIGFFISFLLVFSGHTLLQKISAPPQLIHILLFSYIILLVGIFDDIRELSFLKKLLIQLVLITFFFLNAKKAQIYFLPDWLNYLISFLWIAGITNAFNLLDIKDGLCSGVSLLISASFAVIAFLCGSILVAHIFLILSGCLLAFYILNIPPAKMYMGNSGSHFLGFLFAALSFYLDYTVTKKVYTIFAPLLVLAFPIIDTFFLIIVRAKKGILPLRKSDDHIFLRLIANGTSHRNALIIIYCTTVTWSLTAILVVLGKGPFILGSLALASILTITAITKAIYHRE